MLNKVILNGRLVSDIKKAGDGKYGFLTLAMQRNYKNKEGKYDTDFVDITVSGEKAVSSWEKYFQKGDGVVINGEVHTRKVDKSKIAESVKKILRDAGVEANDEVISRVINAAHPNSADIGIRCSFPEFGTVAKKFGEKQTTAAASTNVSNAEFVSADEDFDIVDGDDDLPF